MASFLFIYEALSMALNINSPGFVDKQQGRADEEGQGRVERRTASLFKAILFLEPEQAISLCWCLFIACLSRRKEYRALELIKFLRCFASHGQKKIIVWVPIQSLTIIFFNYCGVVTVRKKKIIV